ncbi:NAD(P)/FAD-dependent oxidoreductase [Bordetella sp. FB-8]|uniref:NAD(P)/FAD-dependent oxidoreductase n=1 Tax=Bordetella sp. FB-8 TaxID=1159870 RepID=UPI00036AA9FE|nr:NAD(P)/FAD-dependent oxidoreductase [Bordetella sp. FB-8]
MQQLYDAVIVGGGPAGVSCAVWLARLGLSPVLMEAGERLGGLAAANPFANDWIAALPGASGPQIADNLAQSAQAAGVPVMLESPAAQVLAQENFYVVESVGPRQVGPRKAGPRKAVCGRALVIASGVQARNLAGYAPQARWPGVLVGPGSAVVAQDYTGLSVAVLGGGDNAFENFVYVRGRGAKTVHLYSRTVRAQSQWIARAGEAGVHRGDYGVDPAARMVNGRRYDLILVFYGWQPQAAFADGLDLARDERGYIRTDAATAQASLPGVYAIGEVANRMHPCVVTSMADGVVAAKAIQRRREQ